MKGIVRYLADRIRLWQKQNEPSAYIVSYPKSGRTWLRLLIGKTLCDRFGIDPAHMLDTLKLTNLARLTPTTFTHDGSGMHNGCHFSQLETDKTKYGDKKIILLIRDLRDVMVSCYFQATKRINVYDGSISDFVRSETFGIQKCAKWYSIWGQNRHVPKAFHVVRYEDMHGNPQAALKGVLDFIGVPGISPQLLDAAVEFGRFDNMKKMEAAGQFKRQVLTPGNSEDDESFKVRRGKVGGYADYLSPEDCQYVTEVMVQARSPLIVSYLQSEAKQVA